MQIDPQIRHVPAGEGTPLSVHHDRFRLKVDATNTADDILIFETVVMPQTGAGLHTHPARETFYVLAGHFDFVSVRDGKRHLTRAVVGDTVDVPSLVPHGYTNSHKTPGRLLCIFSPAQPMQAFFEEINELLTRENPLTIGTPEYEEASRAIAQRHQLKRVILPD